MVYVQDRHPQDGRTAFGSSSFQDGNFTRTLRPAIQVHRRRGSAWSIWRLGAVKDIVGRDIDESKLESLGKVR